MATKTATTRKKATTRTKATKKRSTTKSTARAKSTRKYSPLAQKEVAKEISRFKKGTAKSGKAGLPVKSRAQAIAIGLSEARAKGAKVPKKR